MNLFEERHAFALQARNRCRQVRDAEAHVIDSFAACAGQRSRALLRKNVEPHVVHKRASAWLPQEALLHRRRPARLAVRNLAITSRDRRRTAAALWWPSGAQMG